MSFYNKLPREYRSAYKGLNTILGFGLVILIVFTTAVEQHWLDISAEWIGYLAIIILLMVGAVATRVFVLIGNNAVNNDKKLEDDVKGS